MNNLELLSLWSVADNSEDIINAENIYKKILSEPDLQAKLDNIYILNIRWNRARNLISIAEVYLNKYQIDDALEQIANARDEVQTCKNAYKSIDDIKQSEDFLNEIEGHQSYIIMLKNKQCLWKLNQNSAMLFFNDKEKIIEDYKHYKNNFICTTRN